MGTENDSFKVVKRIGIGFGIYWLISALISAGIGAAIIYVVAHFVLKFW